MTEPFQPDYALVRRCANLGDAEQYMLVLVAMGIESFVRQDGEGFALFVETSDHDRAASELLAYDVENRNVKDKLAPRRLAVPRSEAAMIYWAVLLFFFAAVRNHAFSIDWLKSGAAQAGLIMDGEWWRAVTALTLHASSAHLLGNLVFGTVFFFLLAQLVGSGVAWAAMVAAGTVGNLANAYLHADTHTSIGASTALFAGIGLLAALRQSEVEEGRRTFRSLRRWAPLAGGFMLLAFLGFSGERTDIMAHVLGFFMGLGGGWLLARFDRNWADDVMLQLKCVGFVAGLLLVAWLIAIWAYP
ncbi:MAG: rhomboid family intramembrane serine protease [Pseudomonadota bacterium]